MAKAEIIDGVVVTPKMVEAGIRAYRDLDGSEGAVWFWVARVFAEMAKASPQLSLPTDKLSEGETPKL